MRGKKIRVLANVSFLLAFVRKSIISDVRTRTNIRVCSYSCALDVRHPLFIICVCMRTLTSSLSGGPPMAPNNVQMCFCARVCSGCTYQNVVRGPMPVHGNAYVIVE